MLLARPVGRVSSFSGGSHRQAFPRRNPGGSGISSFLPLQVTSYCMRLTVDLGLTDDELSWLQERDDLLDKDREKEERIKQLEADLANKTSSFAETEGVVNTLKGDLERLTVELSHTEIVRHNYVRRLLPTVFQRLLSSNEYKKSLSDVFNLAIAIGLSKGVKAACSEEEADAFLATAVNYDPACKDTFMTEFDSLLNKSYPYVEKLVESFQLPLGDLHNNGRRGKVHRLAIGSWTHPGCLALRVRYVTWPLSLGLIQNVLHSGVRCVTWPLALGLIRNVLHSGRSMFRRSSSLFSFSLIIMVRCVGIPIFAGITTSLPYMRLNGVSPLLCFREVRWAQTMLGSSSTYPALSLPNLALIPSIKLLLALSTRPFAYG
uniref:Uncharacterized protein n=1 Tax=Tanacetum cinerariifolium TaxID=118510 RepID=A0A699H5E5_TANCI|nr:hypothetical protein [Tanacetum cinerariifolium]